MYIFTSPSFTRFNSIELLFIYEQTVTKFDILPKKNLIIIFFPLRFNDRFHKTITTQIKTLTRTLTILLINFKIQSFRVGLQQTEFVLSIYFLYFTCQTTIFFSLFFSFNGCSVLNLRSSFVRCGCFYYAFVNIVIFGFDGFFFHLSFVPFFNKILFIEH